MSQDLKTLSAAALKKIARDQGLDFPAMASAPQMLKILADAGVTAAPSETPKTDKKIASTPVKTPKAAKSEKVETDEEEEDEVKEEIPEGAYTVQGNLKMNGVYYKKGDIISVDNTDTLNALLKNGAIK